MATFKVGDLVVDESGVTDDVAVGGRKRVRRITTVRRDGACYLEGSAYGAISQASLRHATREEQEEREQAIRGKREEA